MGYTGLVETRPTETVRPREQLSFTEQFNQRTKHLMTDGVFVGKKGVIVESVDIIPQEQKGKAVAYNLGYTAEITPCRPFFEGFYNKDRRVIGIDYPTHRPEIRGDELPEGFSAYAYRDALAFTKVLMDKGIKEIDLVGQSSGGPKALIENILLTEMLTEAGIKVGSVVIINTFGFSDTTARETLSRLKQVGDHEKALAKENPDLAELQKEGGRALLSLIRRHPINTLLEGLDLKHVDMTTLLARTLGHGRRVAIVQPADDPFVPYAELGAGVALAQQRVRQEFVENLRDGTPDMMTNPAARKDFDTQVAVFAEQEQQNPLIIPIPKEEKAGHLFSGFYPENPNLYVPLAVDALNYFEFGELSNAGLRGHYDALPIPSLYQRVIKRISKLMPRGR